MILIIDMVSTGIIIRNSHRRFIVLLLDIHLLIYRIFCDLFRLYVLYRVLLLNNTREVQMQFSRTICFNSHCV